MERRETVEGHAFPILEKDDSGDGLRGNKPFRTSVLPHRSGEVPAKRGIGHSRRTAAHDDMFRGPPPPQAVPLPTAVGRQETLCRFHSLSVPSLAWVFSLSSFLVWMDEEESRFYCNYQVPFFLRKESAGIYMQEGLCYD